VRSCSFRSRSLGDSFTVLANGGRVEFQGLGIKVRPPTLDITSEGFRSVQARVCCNENLSTPVKVPMRAIHM